MFGCYEVETHLPCGELKRDHGVNNYKVSTQSSHTIWTAQTMQAKGLDGASGLLETKKSYCRKVSLE